MVKEEPDNLIGRELDALVAERVMGWRWLSRTDSSSANPYRSAWLFPLDSHDYDEKKKGIFGEPVIGHSGSSYPAAYAVGPFHEYDGGRKEPSNVPPYSSDIVAAFQVIEKLRKDGYSFCCWDTPEFSSFAGRVAAFRFGVHPPSRDDLEDCFVGSGHLEGSMPLAICRAALKAVLSRVESEV